MANKSANRMKEIINGSCSTPRFTLNPGRRKYNKGSGKKVKKTCPFDVYLYDWPGDHILDGITEVAEKDLTPITVGGVIVTEDSDESGVMDDIKQLLNNVIDVEEGFCTFRFLKRVSRKRSFRLHKHASGFKYDYYGLKDLCGKDCKTLYVCTSKRTTKKTAKKSNKKSMLPQQTRLIDISRLESTTDDDNDDIFDFNTASEKSLRTSGKRVLPFHTEDSPSKKHNKTGGLLDMLKEQDSSFIKGANVKLKYVNLQMACFLLRYIDDFLTAVEKILKVKSDKATDVEHALCQVILVLDSKDESKHDTALNDLFVELKLESSFSMTEILQTIFQTLLSLSCKIWDSCFLKLIQGKLLTKHFTATINEEKELKDLEAQFFKPDKTRCSTLEDVFERFTRKKIIPVPECVKENTEEENVWLQHYFTQCPDMLIFHLDWEVQKRSKISSRKSVDFAVVFFQSVEKSIQTIFSLCTTGMVFDQIRIKNILDSSEVIPCNLIENSTSINSTNYEIGMMGIKMDTTIALFINIGPDDWIALCNGFQFSLLDLKLGSLDKVTIEFAVFFKPSAFYIEKDITKHNIQTPGSFLMDRLNDRVNFINVTQVSSTSGKGNKGNFEELTEKIEHRLKMLHGQAELKKQIFDIAKRAVFDKRRGEVQSLSQLHMVFRGNPGTGKTMAARVMAGIMYDIGLVTNENVVEVQRSDLVSDHIGGTAKKTSAVIEKAMGCVLFVDEAYTLSGGSEKDFGKEAIETLMSAMISHPNEAIRYPMMIFAGYEDEMQKFMLTNPGLARRLKIQLKFSDYTCYELADIVKLKLLARKRKFPLNIRSDIADCFYNVPETVRSRYNAALCEDLIEAIQVCQEERLDPERAELNELFTFTSEDFDEGIKKFLQPFRDVQVLKPSKFSQAPEEVLLFVPGIGCVFGSP